MNEQTSPSSGFKLVKCSHPDCEFQFVEDDDERLFHHLVEDHQEWLDDLWWRGVSE